MSNIDDFFTSAVSGFGAFPVFPGKTLGDASPHGLLFNKTNIVEGFLGDGDYVLIPHISGEDIEYYNNANALQFAVSIANVDANISRWVGFMHDLTDDLIYGIGVDTTTAPDTLYTFSVDSSGTIDNIGNAQLGTDFTGVAFYWQDPPSGTQNTSIQRDSDGSGNLTIRTGIQEAVINIASGAIVSGPTNFPTANSVARYKTTGGHYIGSTVTSGENSLLSIRTPDENIIDIIPVPKSTGLPSSATGLNWIQWKGYIAIVNGSTNSARFGFKYVDLADIDTYAAQMAAFQGVR